MTRPVRMVFCGIASQSGMPEHTGHTPAPPLMQRVGVSRPPTHTSPAAHMAQSVRVPQPSMVYPHCQSSSAHVFVLQPPPSGGVMIAVPPVPPLAPVPPLVVPPASEPPVEGGPTAATPPV